MSEFAAVLNLAPNQESERIAADLVRLLSDKIDGIDAPASERSVLALSCLYASLDHHAGLVLLFGTGLFAPAFALIRPLYEGFIRGTWLGFCATDEQILAFGHGSEPPKISEMIESIESSSPFGGTATLSEAHKRNWSSLCGFAHNSVQQSLLAIQPNEIARNCSREKLNEALGYSGSVATLAAIVVCAVAGKDEVAGELLDEAPPLILGRP